MSKMLPMIQMTPSNPTRSSAKVGLIHPGTDNVAKVELIWPPLGLCRIAKFLADHGHQVTIIEDALNKYPIEEVIKAVADLDFIGVGAMTLQIPRINYLLENIRKHSKATIVYGGPHYSAVKEISDPENEALVIGDGEEAMLDIINGKRGIIQGEASRDYRAIDFSYVDYLKYGDHLIDGTRAISLVTARGCPFTCKFCQSPEMFQLKVIDYPLDAVVPDMVALSKRYNINAFRIMDDTFTLHHDRVRDFCERVKPYNWKMSCLTHVKTIKLSTLKAMKEAGFGFVAVGAESADETVLAMADKRQSEADIINALVQINAAGLKAEMLFVIGLPGETPESLAKTIKLAEKLIEMGAFRIHTQFFAPFPGCDFYNNIDKYGVLIEPDFRNWHHRVPVFVPHGIKLEELMTLAKKFFAIGGRMIGT
ncbi:B12-binding domain-containing radical SAM protein [Candidatus Parcubacteria bacterium]|nr:B12-binding domain-containing radical SAM protein [Candidatus Parcubacteria bacterium]